MTTITLTIDGQSVTCVEGTALSHLLTERSPVLRCSPLRAAPRGLFCGMGLCFECTVEVDGQPRRACLVRAAEGMAVTTGCVASGDGA